MKKSGLAVINMFLVSGLLCYDYNFIQFRISSLYFTELTIKQLKDKIKEYEQKIETEVQVSVRQMSAIVAQNCPQLFGLPL